MADEPGWQGVAHSFPVDHPARDGHFPGNPVIPGAVLLDAVVHRIAAAYKQRAASGEFRGVKFLLPLRPGDSIDIRWKVTNEQEVRFECLQAGRKALSGSLRLNASLV